MLKRRQCFTHGHTLDYWPSLQILISVLLIFPLLVYNRNILLIILIILILDWRQSVGYLARCFLFLFSDFIYLFMLVPTYLKSTITSTSGYRTPHRTTWTTTVLKSVLFCTIVLVCSSSLTQFSQSKVI